MTAPLLAPSPVAPVALPADFGAWRRRVVGGGAMPLIAVAGSRGKTTVVRMLDAVFAAAGMRTATWTDRGVEVGGELQGGELSAWSRALARLGDGGLDIAVQELDWPTVHAVGLPPAVYPVVAVTNVCANSDACLVHPDTRVALRALRTTLDAVRPDGTLVLNGDDYAVAGGGNPLGGGPLGGGETPAPVLLVAHHRDAPLARGHLAGGGTALWLDEDGPRLGTAECHAGLAVAPGREGGAPAGAGGFRTQDLLIAAATAAACGIEGATIAAALADFEPPADRMPGSFNVVPLPSGTAVVDRPAPSWFLRPVLRTLAHRPHARLITVAGRLGGVPEEDLAEVGRLLGRASSVLVVHSEDDDGDRSALLRSGVALNEVPPPVVHVGTESQAVGRAVRMARGDDLLFVLADDPEATLRLVQAGARLGNGAAGAHGRAAS